jgi:hypothetical protein
MCDFLAALIQMRSRLDRQEKCKTAAAGLTLMSIGLNAEGETSVGIAAKVHVLSHHHQVFASA